MTLRFSTFPRTQTPPAFLDDVVARFANRFGENAKPELQYEVDAWHPEWGAGLEIEAGRALRGNAIYRDLIQALVMVEMDYLLLAVPLEYRYNLRGKRVASLDYDTTVRVAQALYGHSRIEMPFSLCVIGY